MTWKTICGAQMLGGLSARCLGLVWLKPVSVSSLLQGDNQKKVFGVGVNSVRYFDHP